MKKTMKKKTRSFANRFYQAAITVLGFGSTLMFMACYAPPPSELQYADLDEVVDSTDEQIFADSTSFTN